jgi:hypothetical protein
MAASLDMKICFSEDFNNPVLVMTFPDTELEYSDANYDRLMTDNSALRDKYQELEKMLAYLRED